MRNWLFGRAAIPSDSAFDEIPLPGTLKDFCSFASVGVGGTPIPSEGEPVVGALKGIPGHYAAFTYSGATLGLIVGELLAYEVVTGAERPMIVTSRPEHLHRGSVTLLLPPPAA